ncbi:MAG: transcriptional regulator [Candidatus Thiodiazotropha sp. (ex. Lucinisca nassula)]|nr:transcriptional regulator [Candidatus Thiodiazotropha sp. (ex. Lucinisca nassula)]MBW9273592.1 transcriptional regulator [Candidatus Thiodiazotropha sp. (ex. Lucinisca nassula)]
MTTFVQLPETGFVRIHQIVGDTKAKPPIPPIIPVSRTAWWKGVKAGRYPKPLKLNAKTTVWRVEDIRNFIQSVGKDEEQAA